MPMSPSLSPLMSPLTARRGAYGRRIRQVRRRQRVETKRMLNRERPRIASAATYSVGEVGGPRMPACIGSVAFIVFHGRRHRTWAQQRSRPSSRDLPSIGTSLRRPRTTPYVRAAVRF